MNFHILYKDFFPRLFRTMGAAKQRFNKLAGISISNTPDVNSPFFFRFFLIVGFPYFSLFLQHRKQFPPHPRTNRLSGIFFECEFN
jgi:hypothetical protein